MATGVLRLRLRAYYDYGYGRTTTTATGVLRLRLRANVRAYYINFFTAYTVYTSSLHVAMYITIFPSSLAKGKSETAPLASNILTSSFTTAQITSMLIASIPTRRKHSELLLFVRTIRLRCHFELSWALNAAAQNLSSGVMG